MNKPSLKTTKIASWALKMDEYEFKSIPQMDCNDFKYGNEMCIRPQILRKTKIWRDLIITRSSFLCHCSVASELYSTLSKSQSISKQIHEDNDNAVQKKNITRVARMLLRAELESLKILYMYSNGEPPCPLPISALPDASNEQPSDNAIPQDLQSRTTAMKGHT